jgi:hypothetical protein
MNGPAGEGPATTYWKRMVEGDLERAASIARDEFLIDPEEPLWPLVTYTFASLPGCPAGFRTWKSRARFGVRAGKSSPWLVREMRAIDRRAAAGP